MPSRADLYFAQSNGTLQFSGGGVNYLLEAPGTRVRYLVYADNAQDVSFRKSTDGGITWSASVNIFTGTVVAISVWPDWASGVAGGLIHVAYTESGASDVLYRSIDTSAGDALSVQTTIFAGASTAAGGFLTITRARGGNLACIGSIDAGAETFFMRSTDVGATWGARSVVGKTAIATQDQCILLPGWGADTQDVMAVFWDASANSIFRQVYDDSADGWNETLISAGMTDTVAATSFPHFAAVPDLTNSRNLLIAWTAVDTVNADLLCWSLTEAAITALADVVTDSGDDQHLAAIGICTDHGYVHAFYAGKSDGSETVATSLNVYCKVSTDGCATWGPETKFSNAARPVKWLATAQRFACPSAVCEMIDESIKDLRVNVSLTQSAVSAMIGA